METNRFSQSPLHSIAINRPAQNLADRKSDAKAASLLPQQIKHGHVGGMMSSALLVHTLKVSVPEQTHRAGKSGPLHSSGHFEIIVRSETAHNSRSKLKLRISR
jgi:hypothetical protein